MKRWIALLLVLVLCLSMLPVVSAQNSDADKRDLWKQIEQIEKSADQLKGASSVKLRTKAYSDSIGQIIEVIEASPAYVQGSLKRNGNFITWRTTDGTINGYNPNRRAEMRTNAVGTPVKLSASAPDPTTKGTKDVAVFQPWKGVDSNFNDHYISEAQRIAGYIGGSVYTYTYTAATIDALANALTSCGYVLLDSHGDSDYSNGDDTTTYANVSYITLLSGSGITSQDQTYAQGPYAQYPHAYMAGYASYNYEEVWCVDGTVVANHMTKKAPNNFFWNGICMGMTTDTICEPLYAKGVGVILGYSESVTFSADRDWLTAFVTKTRTGAAVKDCVSYMKSQVGCPDPVSVYYSDPRPAYPLVRSAQDAYPGHSNRNKNQTVKSTWKPTMIGVTPVKITSQPKSVSVPKGQSTTFKVSATGSSLKYQWQYKKSGESSWSNWSGATSNSLTITASSTNNQCQYRCVVKNACGSVNSSAATLTVITKPTITTQPKAASAAVGKTATFKVAASGSSLKYQWQYRKAGETSWHTWSGKTSSSLTVTASTTNNGCVYRCVVSNSAGSVNSSAVMLTVTNVKPVIVTQPASGKCALGKTVTFKVVVAGSGIKYQWQYRKAGETSWHTWSGMTSSSLTVTASTTNNGCQYRCKYSNSYGSGTSSAATLLVTDVKPSIVTQPSNASAALGKTATFTVKAVGYAVKYQWQYRKAGETTWHNWSGMTSSSLTVTASTTNNGCRYRCVVSNSVGSVNSAAATLTVK